MLPKGWSIRATTDADAAQVLSVACAYDLAVAGMADSDLPSVQRGLRAFCSLVATDQDGRIVAWAYADRKKPEGLYTIALCYHPSDGLAARQPLLSTLMDRLPSPVLCVRTYATPAETDWAATLRRLGFEFSTQTAALAIKLPAEPFTAPGVEVRPVAADELSRFHGTLVDAIEDDPDYSLYGYDDWAEAALAHRVDGDVWLVAIIDGTPVGALQSCGHRKEVVIHHIGVNRGHRRKGLGRALLSEAFRAYAARGHSMARAAVTAVARPPLGLNLLTAAGMTVLYRFNTYDKIGE